MLPSLICASPIIASALESLGQASEARSAFSSSPSHERIHLGLGMSLHCAEAMVV